MSEKTIQFDGFKKESKGCDGLLDGFEIATYEYECGSYCHPNGCQGHRTDIPVGFGVGGVMFFVEGYCDGDYPGPDTEYVETVKKVVEALKEILTKAKEKTMQIKKDVK